MASENINLKDYIRDIPDFPKEGILFSDIMPLLSNADALSAAVIALSDAFRD